MVKTLAEWRKEKGLTQRELSILSGVTEKTISNYENDIEILRGGKFETIEKLADSMNIKVSDIFLGSTSKI